MQVPVADLVKGIREQPPGSSGFTDCARALGEAALCSDAHLAAVATKALFSELVEEWSDRFEPSLCAAYAALMSEVLYAPGSPIADSLIALGYNDPGNLLGRHRRTSTLGAELGRDRAMVKKVLVLSRVTLGADVAVTRPVLLSAASAFPEAVIEFIGPQKNADLIVTGHPFRHREISYGRTALLFDRLLAWNHLRDVVQGSVEGLRRDEYLIVDPDSRLTQLGLLPVGSDDSYHFFESRAAGAGGDCDLGTLATQWCSRSWGVDVSHAGRVAMEEPSGVRRCLSDEDCRPLAAISFGVGGRLAKRVGDRFEDGLLELLRRRGFRIVLDYGLGDDEARVVDQCIAGFAGTVGQLSIEQRGWPGQTDLMTWRGSLAQFGAWTAAANVYLGYDSAAAHLAAAYGTPVIEVFAGAPSERFRQRWTPAGEAPVHILPTIGSVDVSLLLKDVDQLLAKYSLSKKDSRSAG